MANFVCWAEGYVRNPLPLPMSVKEKYAESPATGRDRSDLAEQGTLPPPVPCPIQGFAASRPKDPSNQRSPDVDDHSPHRSRRAAERAPATATGAQAWHLGVHAARRQSGSRRATAGGADKGTERRAGTGRGTRGGDLPRPLPGAGRQRAGLHRRLRALSDRDAARRSGNCGG